MRTLPALALAAALISAGPGPVSAQDQSSPPDAMAEALREFFRHMQPALDEALEFLQRFEGIDDPRHYEMPEVLPNGDIIIRRREDAPPIAPPPEPADPTTNEGTIDL